jgi:hypothetical protein
VFSAGLDFDHHFPLFATTSRTRWAKDFANQAWAYAAIPGCVGKPVKWGGSAGVLALC